MAIFITSGGAWKKATPYVSSGGVWKKGTCFTTSSEKWWKVGGKKNRTSIAKVKSTSTSTYGYVGSYGTTFNGYAVLANGNNGSDFYTSLYLVNSDMTVSTKSNSEKYSYCSTEGVFHNSQYLMQSTGLSLASSLPTSASAFNVGARCYNSDFTKGSISTNGSTLYYYGSFSSEKYGGTAGGLSYSSKSESDFSYVLVYDTDGSLKIIGGSTSGSTSCSTLKDKVYIFSRNTSIVAVLDLNTLTISGLTGPSDSNIQPVLSARHSAGTDKYVFFTVYVSNGNDPVYSVDSDGTMSDRLFTLSNKVSCAPDFYSDMGIFVLISGEIYTFDNKLTVSMCDDKRSGSGYSAGCALIDDGKTAYLIAKGGNASSSIGNSYGTTVAYYIDFFSIN